MSSSTLPTSNLSRLEILRLENIQRNEAFLASLGLDTVTIPIQQNERVVDNNISKKQNKSRRKQLTREDNSTIIGNESSSTSRRSTRLNKKSKLDNSVVRFSGEEEEDDDQLLVGEGINSRSKTKSHSQRQTAVSYDGDEDGTIRNPITAPSLRTFIESLNESHSEDISNSAIVHCVDRIKSMPNRALANRVKAISTGSGNTSREKLLVFYYALKMCGLVKLTSAAASYLHGKWKIQV